VFINNVRYRCSQDDDFSTWHFHSGSGKFQNCIGIQTDYRHLTILSEAVKFALTGSSVPFISDVIISFSDKSGRSWTVERVGGLCNVLLDGRILKQKSEKLAYILALIDSDGLEEKADLDINSLVRKYEILKENDKFFAHNIKEKSSEKSEINKIADINTKELLEKCNALVGKKSFFNKNSTSDLCARLEPLFLSYRDNLSHNRELLIDENEHGNVDAKLVKQLSQEVDLLNEIETVAKPVLEPSASPKLLGENLRKVDDIETFFKTSQTKSKCKNFCRHLS
jgi:hypothetical protein